MSPGSSVWLGNPAGRFISEGLACMGLDPKEVRDVVVRPALELLGLPSQDAAERLLMGTADQESGFDAGAN